MHQVDRATLGNKERAQVGAKHDLREVLAENERLRLENEDLRFDLNRLRASTEQQQQQIFELHKRLEEGFQLRVDGDAERELARLRAKEQLLREVLASRSWRITRLYRVLGRLLKK